MADQPSATEVDRWAKELGKGGLRAAILAVLEAGESYGYALLGAIDKNSGSILQPTEAAVYPLLKDMENKGYLTSQWKATQAGVPPRKYYRLTAEGAWLLAGMREAWKAHRKGMQKILEAKP